MNNLLKAPVLAALIASLLSIQGCQTVPMGTNCYSRISLGDILHGKTIEDANFDINCQAYPN